MKKSRKEDLKDVITKFEDFSMDVWELKNYVEASKYKDISDRIEALIVNYAECMKSLKDIAS